MSCLIIGLLTLTLSLSLTHDRRENMYGKCCVHVLVVTVNILINQVVLQCNIK